jgi:hypothetical protein
MTLTPLSRAGVAKRKPTRDPAQQSREAQYFGANQEDAPLRGRVAELGPASPSTPLRFVAGVRESGRREIDAL